MKYYYNKDGKNHGPVTLEELQALAAQGAIQKQTPVIELGKKEWLRWGAFEAAMGAASAPAEPAAASAPQSAPAPVAPARKPVARRAVVASAGDEAAWDEKFAFVGKIAQVYDTIDRLCEKVCVLPGGLVDTPEQYKKNLSFLSSLVGVGTLVCIIGLILGQGLYQNIGALVALLLGAAVVQYICYQMYSAMSSLIFGNKIKLSSLWLPRTMALSCALFLLICLVWATQQSGLIGIMQSLSPAIFLAAVGYSCVNCSKLSVTLSPEEVVPGRELVNLVRFVVRVFFTSLHVLTPVYMLIIALCFLSSGQKELLPPGMPIGIDSLFFILSDRDIVYGLVIAALPVFTLPLYYLCSFLPDIVESFFIKGSGDRH